MWLKTFLVLFLLMISSITWSGDEIRIGVLSHRGDEATLRTWSPMADYLTRSIPDKTFRIIPLRFDEIDPAIRDNQIDFLLVNPGIYVAMEARHRISRIATLNKLVLGSAYNVFGGVIFTLRGRQDINKLSDLKGNSFMAVDQISLGGFQMAWRELKAAGINPHKDLKSLHFGGIHDEVVNAVRGGLVDVGTVRTGILESMVAAGKIQIEDFKIINQQTTDGFPALHSTRLYPEWPISKLQQTPNTLARQVAIALLKMNEARSAISESIETWGQYDGWTIPLEYRPVHEVLQELKLPPYERLGQFTLTDAINKYWYWLVTSLVFLLVMMFMTTWVSRLNRALRKSKQRLENQYSLILDSVADGIYGVDLEGNSTFVNEAMEKITGWKAENVIGSNQHEVLHHTRKDGSPHPAKECPVYQTFQDDKPRFIEEDLFWKADGTAFPVEYTSTPLKDEGHKTIGSVVVFRDISERKKAEKQARQYQKELAHVARLSTMGEMASGMAHELNQPLTAIAANADACIRLLELKDNRTDLLMDTLDTIGTQARRAGGIIQQLRQFVRKEEAEYSFVDLNELIKEVIILVRHDLDLVPIRLITHLDPEMPKIQVQPIQIDQVILNLVRNAIEAMTGSDNSEKILMIETSQTDDHMLMVSVTDTGPGIAPKVLDQLFTPFITTKQQGMGLGLSISEGIILAHDGKLSVKNKVKPETGAVFSFTIPLQERSK